jgi:hypothetical protein
VSVKCRSLFHYKQPLNAEYGYLYEAKFSDPMTKEIDFSIIELEPDTYHPLIKAAFDLTEEYWWVIDSGASKSVMDINFSSCYTSEDIDPVMATGIGKEIVSTSSGIIPSFTLGGTDFGQLNVALVDFKHINQEYSKLSDKKIIGLIGCDFLYSHEAVIDFKRKKLIISF